MTLLQTVTAYLIDVDRAVSFGVKAPAKVAEAREVVDRAMAMADDATRIRHLAPTELLDKAVAGYISDDLTAEDLALISAQAHAGDNGQAATLIERAMDEILSPVRSGLVKLGDLWTVGLQVPVSKVLEGFDRIAAQLPAAPFTAADCHPAAWHNLTQVLDLWNGFVDLDKALRGGRESERWLYPDLVPDGPEYRHRERFASQAVAGYRAGATPGLWTAKQIQVATTADLPPAA